MNRKPVSVFKSICWGIAIFLISFVLMFVTSLLWGIFLGWLMGKIDFVGRLLSNKVIFFLFFSATTAEIGHRVGQLIIILLAKPMEKTRNIGKGFLGAGIVLVIYCIFGNIISAISNGLVCLDLAMGAMGFWYIMFGNASEGEENDD